MFVFFVSLQLDDFHEIENESKLFDHFVIVKELEKMEKFASQIYCDTLDDLKYYTELFCIDFDKIGEKIYKIQVRHIDMLSNEYLEENYNKWIELSNRENTMDEFGSLLEIFKILKMDNSNDKYLVVGDDF